MLGALLVCAAPVELELELLPDDVTTSSTATTTAAPIKPRASSSARPAVERAPSFGGRRPVAGAGALTPAAGGGNWTRGGPCPAAPVAAAAAVTAA